MWAIYQSAQLWAHDEQALYWTDILECEIHRFQLHSGEHKVFSFKEEPGCFALRENGGFIVALRSGIWLTDAQGQLETKIGDNPNNPALARFNDGGVDPVGRFWAGTYWGPRDYNGALLCRVDNDLHMQVMQCDILGANGLAFSPDSRWMYTSDTPNHVIYRTPLNTQGERGYVRSGKPFHAEMVVLMVLRWIAKDVTGARFSTDGALPVSLLRGKYWKNTLCPFVARLWSASVVRK